MRKAGLQVSKQNIRLEACVFNSNTKPLNMGEIYIPYKCFSVALPNCPSHVLF